MKKLLYAMVCGIFCLFTQTYFVADAIAEVRAGSGTTNNIANNQSAIRVGFCEQYGFLSTNNPEKPAGYGYAYIQEMAKITGWKYEFVPCAWNQCMNMLETGKLDIFGPMQKTPVRSEKFNFPKEPQGFEYGGLYTLASNTRLFYEDFESFNGIRVATIPDTYFEEPFLKYSGNNDFVVTFVYAENIDEMLALLENGEVDAIICGSLLEQRTTKMIAKFSVAPFYIALSKHRPELLKQFNAGIRTLRTENMHFDTELYHRFYQDSTISKPAFTRAEINYIKNAPVLSVGYDSSWKPLEFYDKENKRFAGIVADILRAVERDSGLRFNFVNTASHGESIKNFQDGTLDIVTLPASASEINAPGVTRSTPLITVPMLMVAKADTKPVRSMTIGFRAGSPFEAEARDVYSDSTLVSFPTLAAGIQAINKGEITTMMVNSFVFGELLRDPRNNNLRPLASTRFSVPVQLAIHDNSNGQLTAVINKAIERLTQEEIYRSVFSNTLRVQSPLSLEQVLNEYAYPLIIIIFLVLFLIFAAVLTNKQVVEKKLRQVAYTDAKTGIENWNSMERNGPSMLGHNSAYVLVDINNFKLLNDYFGFETGDRVLVHIARTLTQFTGRNELAVRCSSDLFGVLLQIKGEHDLRARLIQLTKQILACRPVQEMEGFNMSLSYGICLNKDKTTALPTLNDRADIARKLFKNNYRTTYAFYDDDIHTHIIQEREIESKMVDALKNGEFHAYYQPKYDLRNDCIVGAEALVRWLSPDQGIIHPCNFIPLFERNGFIMKIDMHMLEQVCKRLREWLNEGRIPVPISVNFSKLHIMNTNFVQDVMQIVQKYSIPPQLIELELTETGFLENNELLLRIMREFTGHGFTLSMDDFGTGYSSLNMLQEIPVNVLKLDRAFLGMSNDSMRAKNIIAHVVRMAKDLDMLVVSEGVETIEHVRFLKGVGCDMAQGFFYSPPVPVETFAQMVFYPLERLAEGVSENENFI